MKAINVYLQFDGNCREAAEFYAKALGGEVKMMSYAEMPHFEKAAAHGIPPESKDRIMHAHIEKGGTTLMMASDVPVGAPFTAGNNYNVSIECDSVEESDRVFAALSAGGTVTMPPQETFWAKRFAMFSDRYGTKWMLNVSKPMTGEVAA